MNNKDYIIIEGLDYCGKSTFINTLKERKTHSFVSEPTSYLPLLPIREMMLKGGFTSQTILALSIAQRIELFRLSIKRSLDNNIPVISDRSFISSMVYTDEKIMNPKEILDLHLKLYNPLILAPTKVIYMSIPFETFLERIWGVRLHDTEKQLLDKSRYEYLQSKYEYSLNLLMDLNKELQVLDNSPDEDKINFIYK